MSAIKPNLIKLLVTNGDAVADNRLKGRSNTGTYFICSENQFNEFEEFFKDNIIYFIDLEKVKQYEAVFNKYAFSLSEYYPDKMNGFNEYVKTLVSLNENPKVDIGIRVNGSRIFARFLNNENMVENSLRHILYGEFTYLIFELLGNNCYIYPSLDLNKLKDVNVDNLVDFEL